MKTNAHEERKKNPLFEFAYLGKIEETLLALKELAMPERWEYVNAANTKPFPILFSYLVHTFIRLREENKILRAEKYVSFNTGLITPNQEEIFMVFKERPDSTELYFLEFCKESGRNMARFSPLPERPVYFKDVSELFYDYKLPIRVNVDHIVDDEENFSRFPSAIRGLPKHQLVNTFRGAIDHAIKRIQRNYKTAVPQYYRGPSFPDGQLQLLIPLCLTDPQKADLALAIYKTGDTYVGRTCLTLDMAMNNARLITKPDDDWLNP